MPAPTSRPSPSDPVPVLPGMAPLAGRYDGFVLDLWGVLHDGVAAYPGAVDCLEALHARDKRVVLLSNAPRRAAVAADAMERMGIARGLYDDLLTSGEMTWRALKERRDPWYARLGRRCHHLGPERDRNMREGLDLDFVARVEDADFILNTGPWEDDETVADYDPVLAAGVGRGLPMVCANPDLEVIRGGRRVICAGALAARYEALGGTVRYHGKPHAGAYEACLELPGMRERRRVLAVGDSLRTDIAGAEAAGLDAVLVTGAVHADELGIAPGAMPDPARVAALCRGAGRRPVAAIPAFVW